jgi:hypothetical protein
LQIVGLWCSQRDLMTDDELQIVVLLITR